MKIKDKNNKIMKANFNDVILAYFGHEYLDEYTVDCAIETYLDEVGDDLSEFKDKIVDIDIIFDDNLEAAYVHIIDKKVAIDMTRPIYELMA